MADITKREQILAAAAGIFGETGYHGAKVEDIAVRAGIGKGTIYEYFSSKKELFEETIFHTLEGSFIQATDCVNKKRDPIEKLKVLIDLQVSLLEKDGSTATLFMKNSGDIQTEMLERLIEYREKVLDFISGIIEEGIESGVFRQVDSYLAAVLFMGVMQEAAAVSCSGLKIGDRTLDTMIDYMINGIGT
jgi:TetR/AcrR family fatty acid metabolism transcriptional regulator